MVECCGLIGKIFGHKFESHLEEKVEQEGKVPPKIPAFFPEEMAADIERGYVYKSTSYRHVRKCKRCGMQIYPNDMFWRRDKNEPTK